MEHYPIQSWIDKAMDTNSTFTLTKYTDYQDLHSIQNAIRRHVKDRGEYTVKMHVLKPSSPDRADKFSHERLLVVVEPTFIPYKRRTKSVHPYQTWIDNTRFDPIFLYYVSDFQVSCRVMRNRINTYARDNNLFVWVAKSIIPHQEGIWVQFSTTKIPRPTNDQLNLGTVRRTTPRWEALGADLEEPTPAPKTQAQKLHDSHKEGR